MFLIDENRERRIMPLIDENRERLIMPLKIASGGSPDIADDAVHTASEMTQSLTHKYHG